MHSTLSVAAMILGAAAIILGTVGVGTCKTTSERVDTIDTKVRSTDDRLAFRWVHLPRPTPGRP